MRSVQQEKENEFRFVHLLFMLGILAFCLACWWFAIWLAMRAWDLIVPYVLSLFT